MAKTHAISVVSILSLGLVQIGVTGCNDQPFDLSRRSQTEIGPNGLGTNPEEPADPAQPPAPPSAQKLDFPPQSSICFAADGKKNVEIRQCEQPLEKSGAIAGNIDDYYLNEDGGHAPANLGLHPQVTKIYDSRQGFVVANTLSDAEIQAIYADPMKVKIGNASVVYNMKGEQVSIPRYNMGHVKALPIYEKEYTQNWLHWHPEHTDHDEVDKYWYMAPFANVSQGSSGSELEELNKVFYTLSAFTPDTKKKLKASGTIIPTLQMIHRMSYGGSVDAYLSSDAHPSAIDGSFKSAERLYTMVRIANAMKPTQIPPVAKMKVISEDFTPGGYQEQLFTTPASLARTWVGGDLTPRRIVVSLEDSQDPNRRALTYVWKILRGSSSLIEIKLLNSQGSIAEITFHPHGDVLFPLLAGRSIHSALEVVGAFVHNGVYYSMPGFITSYGGTIQNANY